MFIQHPLSPYSYDLMTIQDPLTIIYDLQDKQTTKVLLLWQPTKILGEVQEQTLNFDYLTGVTTAILPLPQLVGSLLKNLKIN